MKVDIDNADGDGMGVKHQRNAHGHLNLFSFTPHILTVSRSLSLSNIGWFGRERPHILNSDKELLYQAFLKSKFNRIQQSF